MSPAAVGKGLVLMVVPLVVPLLAKAPIKLVWFTFPRNTLEKAGVREGEEAQERENVALEAAAMPASLRINAAT
jgi:hypothetical protein